MNLPLYFNSVKDISKNKEGKDTQNDTSAQSLYQVYDVSQESFPFKLQVLIKMEDFCNNVALDTEGR